jgi:hypothetical protein
MNHRSNIFYSWKAQQTLDSHCFSTSYTTGLMIFVIFFFKLYVFKFSYNWAKIKDMFLCMFLMHDHYIRQYLHFLSCYKLENWIILYA